MDSAPPIISVYRASTIAEAIGLARQTVDQYLRDTPCDREVNVGGITTRAWNYLSLPAPLRQRIEAAARARQLSTGEQLLISASELWQPKIPLQELAPEVIGSAELLRDALEGSIQRLNDARLTEAEFDELGVRDYACVFHREVSAKHFRRLLDRTIYRDGGRRNWQRLEIYLPDQLARVTDQVKPSLHYRDELLFQLQTRRRNPTAVRDIWIKAIEWFEEESNAGVSDVRRQILDLLWSEASFLARSRESLRKTFERKLQGGPNDGRRLRHGVVIAVPIPEEELSIMTAENVFKFGNRPAQTLRACFKNGFTRLLPGAGA